MYRSNRYRHRRVQAGLLYIEAFATDIEVKQGIILAVATGIRGVHRVRVSDVPPWAADFLKNSWDFTELPYFSKFHLSTLPNAPPPPRIGKLRMPLDIDGPSIITIATDIEGPGRPTQQTQNICITFIQCWANVSLTLAQHCINLIQMFCVRWIGLHL